MALAETPYLPVKGSAWRLVAADVNGDGVNKIVYSARDGAIRCVNPEDGAVLWEVPLGGFAYELRTADINGDSKPEFIAPCADGTLYVISHEGEVLWTFEAQLQLMDAVVAYPRKGKEPVIICGGFDRQIYMLSSKGKLLHQQQAPEHFVSRLAAGDLDGDGKDELVVIDRRIKMAVYDINRRDLELRDKQWLMSGRENWENTQGRFNAFSVRCADIDNDGKDEIILGESLWIRQAVMALDAEGERLWLTPGLNDHPDYDRSTSEYYSTAFVRPVNLLPDREGLETLVLAGSSFRLIGSDGEVLEHFEADLGFTDLLIDGDTLWLGSVPNGDETLYRIDLSVDWKKQILSLKRQGLPKRIGENIAALREQVLAHDGTSPIGGPIYDLRLFHLNKAQKNVGMLTWFRDQFGQYDNLLATGSIDLLEDQPAIGTDGQPFPGTHSGSKPRSREDLVSIIETFEENEIPVLIHFAHGAQPQLTLKTAEALLKAGPTYLTGFTCAETEHFKSLPRFYEHYFGPLADLCVEYGGKRCTSHNKGVWWMSVPSREEMFDLLFEGDRKTVLTAAVENSNSRTPEINLMARLGLRQAGLIKHMEVAVVLDLFTATRYHEWEYPKHGHPFLRLLAVQTLMGGDAFHMRIEHMNKEGFTQTGHESTEIIFHMLGKGLLMAPEPENMAGLSTLGIAVHNVPMKWLNEAHNGHSPDDWLDWVDNDLEDAVIPHNGVTWGYTQTPEHALQSVLFNKKEQFGHIPATPYGPIAIVPAHANLDAVAGVEEWWHTDGIELWREGGKKLTGMKAAEALKESFEKAADNLPFRPFGDDVFFHTVRMDDSTYRIYAIDPGWLNPRNRRVEVKIQLDGDFAIRDLLSGEALDVNERRSEFTVPAGCLRILEARSI